MSTQIVKQDVATDIEHLVIGGDLKSLTPEQRLLYYRSVCASLGLNPLTRPFEYITLNGKLTLYARKDCTDQLRSVHNISVNIVAREVVDGCYVVTSRAKNPSGREDESIGAVPLDKLTSEAKCNAMMKCETKAKRRVTLSICGLGILDETEIETIPSARTEEPERKKISFKKESATPNSGQVVPSVPKGGANGTARVADKPAAAVPGPELITPAAADASLVDQLEKSIAMVHDTDPEPEYIPLSTQAELLAKIRVASPNLTSARRREYLHTWLADHEYFGDDGNTTLSKIKTDNLEHVTHMLTKWISEQ